MHGPPDEQMRCPAPPVGRRWWQQETAASAPPTRGQACSTLYGAKFERFERRSLCWLTLGSHFWLWLADLISPQLNPYLGCVCLCRILARSECWRCCKRCGSRHPDNQAVINCYHRRSRSRVSPQLLASWHVHAVNRRRWRRRLCGPAASMDVEAAVGERACPCGIPTVCVCMSTVSYMESPVVATRVVHIRHAMGGEDIARLDALYERIRAEEAAPAVEQAATKVSERA
jgi:hypothetical protein